jgi:hypothetical protein
MGSGPGRDQTHCRGNLLSNTLAYSHKVFNIYGLAHFFGLPSLKLPLFSLLFAMDLERFVLCFVERSDLVGAEPP